MDMTERVPDSPTQEPAEAVVLTQFDDVLTPSDGYIAAPASVRVKRKPKIYDIMPGDWRFVSNSSTMVDEDSGRMSIDPRDNLPPQPTRVEDLEARPAVMRVLRGIGERALDGYIIDFRYVTLPLFEDRELSEGVGSAAFMQRQQDYGAELPLGVIFKDIDTVRYIGHAEVVHDALHLAQQVDVFVQKLKHPVAPRRAQKQDWPFIGD